MTNMSKRGMIRLLLSDVDGTLLTGDKVLTEDAKAAVREPRRSGIVFAITSGRPPRGMRMLIEPLGLDGAIAGFNGGVLFNPDMSVIASHRLDPASARRTLDLLASRGLNVWVYTADAWLIRDAKAPHVALETSNVAFAATVVPSFTLEHLARVVKIVGGFR
jgi:hydroxymethylpyrimidine pyrophosphatase-like HAD family hydrolase